MIKNATNVFEKLFGVKLAPSPLTHYYLHPQRVVWQSSSGVRNATALVGKGEGQVIQVPVPACALEGSAENPAGVLLDFGVEVQGYVEIFTAISQTPGPRSVRVRFGESASEAMSELGGAMNSQTDHAMRDQMVLLPSMGKKMVGPSGFRFVRIDAYANAVPVEISEVRAVLMIRDIPHVGSFCCDDERINRIWSVGAYTVYLNMQEYLWDGIKRDRLIWAGDMHPEMSTINSVFGFNEVVPQSLDVCRDAYAPNEWMNGISSYSMWWVIMQRDWWLHHGDRSYLEAQGAYLGEMLKCLVKYIGKDGDEILTGRRFLDWPTAGNEAAVHEGLHSLMILALEAGVVLCEELGDFKTANICMVGLGKLRKHTPGAGVSKQSTALMSMAGLCPPEKALALLKKGGPQGLSTFYGYYVLEALAGLSATGTALDFISSYWGGMLDYGATTFWEDFDIEWLKNAGRIDELVPDGQRDLHGSYGNHCYKGFRHSLCHGWASGPTAWLSRHILGVRPLTAGFKTVEIAPNLCHLQWAKGTYPTPHGPIHVSHWRAEDGGIESTVTIPKGIDKVVSRNTRCTVAEPEECLASFSHE